MNMITKSCFSIIVCCLLVAITTNAFSDDTPKRKPGLWEVKGQIEGMPDMGAVQECVDQNTDNLFKQDATAEGVECKTPEVKRSGDKITVHTECKLDEETTTITDYSLQGSLDSAYEGVATIQSKSPEITRKSTITMSARWLGPCKPGQNPGDTITP
jgi:hypothetical protein